MKRIIVLLAFIVGLYAYAGAQSVAQPLLSNVPSGVKPLDTITNTGVVTMSSKIVVGNPSVTTVLATYTKLTGTVAGTAKLLGSINGTDWTSASSTSYTVTDVASQSTSWTLTGSPFLYYRVETTGSGTSTYTVKGQVFTRK